VWVSVTLDVNVVVHADAFASVPTRVHVLGEKVRCNRSPHWTVPPGTVCVPGSLSVTVAVHVEGSLRAGLEGEHEIVVVVGRRVTETAKLGDKLLRWTESPG